MINRTRIPVLSAVAMLAMSSAVLAEGRINVQVNQAKVVKLARPADTIIVGNPKIADASVQDAQTIVLTGKGFGITNLVILDQDGKPIVDEQVSVSRDTTDSVRVYRRAAVQTLHCAPVCEQAQQTTEERSSDASVAINQ